MFYTLMVFLNDYLKKIELKEISAVQMTKNMRNYPAYKELNIQVFQSSIFTLLL